MDETLSTRKSVWAYLELLRPPNIITAIADVLAGLAVAGTSLTLSGWSAPVTPLEILALVAATTGLYGGGVVLNDVFDAPLDADERPERPIPSGRASRSGAASFGGLLLVAGIWFALIVGLVSAAIATLVAGGAVLYDSRAKHHVLFGPVVMGLCRGGNLMLGVSAVASAVVPNLYLMLIPLAFVGAITSMSQGEVHGGRRWTGIVALILIGGMTAGLLALGLRPDYSALHASPFVVLLAARVIPPFFRATRNPEPDRIRTAVKAGVVALIPMDAAIAAGFGGWLYGTAILLLLVVSFGLARVFEVT